MKSVAAGLDTSSGKISALTRRICALLCRALVRPKVPHCTQSNNPSMPGGWLYNLALSPFDSRLLRMFAHSVAADAATTSPSKAIGHDPLKHLPRIFAVAVTAAPSYRDANCITTAIGVQ